MKNYKIKLQKLENKETDDFIFIVKIIPAKTKKQAIEQIFKFENINEFKLVSCEVRS